MRQFFAEALMIVALGAALGLALSLGLVVALGALPIKEFVGVPTISATVLAATLALLALVAFAAGLMPARRAAALDPVEALRT
jgi:putative ABC transport system permease protein